MSSAPFELRWGIIATGGISTNFAKVRLAVIDTRNLSHQYLD
jgi:hypothetical protein